MGCTVVICPSTQGRRVRPPGRTGGGGKRDCMHYQYQVAGIAVGFRLPFRLTITEESQAFLRELGEPASGFQVHFLPVPALDPPEPDGHWEVCQYHMETASERRVYHCPTPQAPPYARTRACCSMPPSSGGRVAGFSSPLPPVPGNPPRRTSGCSTRGQRSSMATGPPSARWGAAGRPLACLMPVPPEFTATNPSPFPPWWSFVRGRKTVCAA